MAKKKKTEKEIMNGKANVPYKKDVDELLAKDVQEVSEIIDQAEEMYEEKKNKSINFISSGCDIFDLALGGGFPLGKIVNIVGDKSTGKTLLTMECIAMAKKEYGDKLKWFYDDAEAGFSFDSSHMYGFSIIDDTQEHSYTIEDFGANITKQLNKIKKDEYLIYVLDSLDSLTSSAELKRQKEREKLLAEGKDPSVGTYGLEKQKMLSEFFRLKRREIKDKNCLLIVISQVRTNINAMFGNKFSRTGGKALDFYASQIIWLSEVEKKKKKDRVVGITIKAKVNKNKVGLPFRQCFINILFDYGVDNISSNIDFLYDLKTDSGKLRVKKVEWLGNEYKPNQLIDEIEKTNSEGALALLVVEKWNEIEESIASKRKKK